MANAPQKQSPRPAPRLYLVAPRVNDPADLAQKFDRILGTADVAAVLLRLPQDGERALIDYAKIIVPAVQAKGVALLLDGHAELVARAGADGAHLTGIEALIEALDTLKPQWIAGAGGLHTRHDAMRAGERGADYVMFGEPAARRPPFAASSSALPGGPSCSSCLASPMPKTSRRWQRLLQQVQISWRWANSSFPTGRPLPL